MVVHSCSNRQCSPIEFLKRNISVRIYNARRSLIGNDKVIYVAIRGDAGLRGWHGWVAAQEVGVSTTVDRSYNLFCCPE